MYFHTSSPGLRGDSRNYVTENYELNYLVIYNYTTLLNIHGGFQQLRLGVLEAQDKLSGGTYSDVIDTEATRSDPRNSEDAVEDQSIKFKYILRLIKVANAVCRVPKEWFTCLTTILSILFRA